MKGFPLIILLSLVSCSEYNADKCEDLAIAAFRGFPKESNEYKHNCQNVPHEISIKKCQQVLEFFILKGKIEEVEQTFGEKAAKCLTTNDLKKFGR